MSQHCELHDHSEWSLLDGVGSRELHALRAAELGHCALAMTEHAVLSGTVHHMDACRKVGILPIVGLEAYYRRRRVSNVQIEAMRKRGEDVEAFYEYFHMVILAKDVRGWRTLKLISSESYRSGFYRKPCIDDDLLERHHEGIIISTSCVAGYVPQAILRGDDAAVKQHCEMLDRLVGDDWYFELQPHGFEDLTIVNRVLPGLADAWGKPLVAARDAHAPDPSWVETQHVSISIRTKRSMVSENRHEAEADEKYDMKIADTAYVASAETTKADFLRFHPYLDARVVDQAIANTGEIASRCAPWMMDRSPKLPRYCDTYEQEYLELRRRVYAGLEAKGKAGEQNWIDAVEKELDIYRDRRFCAFFLITDDMIRWLRSTDGLPPCEWDPNPAPTKKPQKVGLGRGSAGACRVAYSLKITLVNAEAYEMWFERFLNIGRKGLPDIDIDLTVEGERLAKEWLKRTRGKDKVYDMIAHGTLAARGALRRVSMVYDVEFAEITAVTKQVPEDESDVKLEVLREHVPELARYAERHPKAFEHSVRLQGSRSTQSEHASAVVISDVPLEQLMPVMKKSAKDDYMVTAFGDAADKPVTSDLGFLKYDLLRLVQLSKQGYAEELVRRVHGVDLDLDKLPTLEDPHAVDAKAMNIFSIGAKLGIFQWDGKSNMASATKQMKPESILHLAAMNAGVRPGVSQHLDEVIRRRHGGEFEYWDPSIEPALAETWGLPLFQEQIMAIFELLGGYSRAEADDVRRIMGKYYRMKGDAAFQMLDLHRERFVDSAATICQGGRELADQIWHYCGNACEYLFNRCVTGDTVVERGGGGGAHSGSDSAKITVAELYEKWHSKTSTGAKYRSPLRGVTLLQMDEDGVVRPARCAGVNYEGVKPVYRVTTKSGRAIEITANHPMLLSNGSYRRCDELVVGDELVAEPGAYLDGERRAGTSRPRTGHSMKSERARGRGYDQCGFPEGASNPSFIDGRTGLLAMARLHVRKRAGNRCEQCGQVHVPEREAHALEFAHLVPLSIFDGDYARYHSADNLRLLCNSCHKRLDYSKGERVRRWSKGRPTFSDPIVSIEYVGEKEVYDVVMDTESHNFVANGLISHNTHALEYSLIAYGDAYLKAHYPDAFYASLLTFPPAWVKKPANRSAFYERCVREARAFGIDVRPPDVNLSDQSFTIEGDAVRFGLTGIKGLGPAMVTDVINNRPFTSLEDMGLRLTACNAAGRHALAQAGAMDRFNARANLTVDERAEHEEDRIGVALSGEDKLAGIRDDLRPLLHTQDDVEAAHHGQALVVGGEIISGREVRTKRGPSLKLTVAFGADEYLVSVPPWDYNDGLKALIRDDVPIVVRGSRDVEWDCVAADEIRAAVDVLGMMIKEREQVAA